MESIQIFFCKNKAVKIGLFGDTLFFSLEPENFCACSGFLCCNLVGFLNFTVTFFMNKGVLKKKNLMLLADNIF